LIFPILPWREDCAVRVATCHIYGHYSQHFKEEFSKLAHPLKMVSAINFPAQPIKQVAKRLLFIADPKALRSEESAV
jgi:hypothetical protein